jgi:peptide deformylase
MKITDHLVQLLWEEEYDKSPLTRESFPVNMRLYKTSPGYRRCILEAVRYMDEHLRSHFEDYPDPRGVAAANLGLPYRIIGFKKGAVVGAKAENQFCLNPKITKRSPGTTSTNTNCGSLRLPQNVSVDRHYTIDLEYFDLEGNLVRKENIGRTDGGFTIQHEVDQTNGKTIIDMAKKESSANIVGT